MGNCEDCGARMERGWEYCPKCGAEATVESDGFSDIFEKINKEMAQMSKAFERQVEAIDITPMFRKMEGHGNPRGIGFAIKIVSSGDKRPQVSVQTFGGANQEELKKQVYQQLGLGPETHERGRPKVEQPDKRELFDIKKPKQTEEPKTDIKKVAHSVLVDVHLPKVKNVKDVEIKDLEGSIEVKAVTGNKAYFKILKKPEKFSLKKAKLEKEILRLEFS